MKYLYYLPIRTFACHANTQIQTCWRIEIKEIGISLLIYLCEYQQTNIRFIIGIFQQNTFYIVFIALEAYVYLLNNRYVCKAS